MDLLHILRRGNNLPFSFRVSFVPIRFFKTEQMHKIAVGLVINVWFFGYKHLIQQI